MSDGNTHSNALLCAAHDAFASGTGVFLVLPDGSARHVTTQERTGGGGRDPGVSDCEGVGVKNGGDCWSTPHPHNFPFRTVDEMKSQYEARTGIVTVRWMAGRARIDWNGLARRAIRRLTVCGPTGPKIPLGRSGQ